MRRFTTFALALGLALTPHAAAHAATFVLDGSTGADYDAVGDGWFFTSPPNQPPDGVGDMGGQLLAIAYKTGVLEMRAMAEFPLSPLAGLTAADIQSATVTFTIDDVLSTLGPGAELSTEASSPIAVYAYPADGAVTVADFAPAGLAQLQIVNVGTITDASLDVSGPLPFDVDATQRVKDALTGGETALGILLGTLDSATGTSLDDAPQAPRPTGRLPYITIVTAPQTPPVLDAAGLECQKAIGKASAALIKTELKAFTSCLDLVLKDNGDGSIASGTAPKCAKSLADDPESKLAKGAAKFSSTVSTACSGVDPSDLGNPCGGAEDVAALTACILAAHEDAVVGMVRAQYGSACLLLTAVGLDGAHPDVCAP
jgi:hypothetical protein